MSQSLTPTPDPRDGLNLSFFADAFRDSPAPTIILSSEGAVLFWNPAAEKMFGWTAEEAIGKPLPFIPPEKTDEHRAMRQRDLSGEGFTGRHISRRRKDGAQLEISVSTAPIRDAQGRVSGIISVYTDITAQKQEEESLRVRQRAADRQISELADLSERLRRQQAELRLVIDGVPGMIAYIDREFRYRFLNRRYAEWFNRPVTDFEGKTIDETLGREWLDDIRPHLQTALDGVLVSFERPVVRDGETYHFNATYVPDIGDDGSVRGLVTLIQDITEQKRALEALRNSEERFRRMVEIAAQGIWIAAPDGRTTFVNPRMAGILGYSTSELLDRSFHEFLHPDDRDRAIAGFRARKIGDTSPREYRFIRRDGALAWLDFTATAMHDESGALTGVLAMCTDVTERKLADEQLRQTQKLESLGILAGGLAHDFNNLLVGVIGNASLAMEIVPETSTAIPLLRDVLAASERAAQLTRQMLAYAGKEHRGTTPTDVTAVVRELSPLLRTSIPKLVDIKLKLEANLPLVLAGRAQLEQVLMNLVINGAEAIPPNSAGTVTVSTACRRLSNDDHRLAVIPIADDGQPHVAVSVRDDGAGMNLATQQRIFDPFFTTKFDGRGLGLSAVLGIVRSHNGTITLQTAPGQGTEFTVLLPAAPAGTTAEPVRAPEPIQRGKGTILVVDDEPFVRDAARRALERSGYTVLVGEDGLAAIDLVRQHPEISAVLLDFAMPKLSGDSAATEIGKLRPELPIVLSSGYSEREAAERFTDRPHSAFLPKPYNVRQLLEVVGRLAGKE